MESNKLISRPGYLLAAMLFLSPLFDVTMSVWPLRFGEERWRYGAVGALSNITLIPLLALLICLVLAISMDHRRVRRVLGWLCAIFAVIIAGLTVMFILDYFQTRTMVKPQFLVAMRVATMASLVKQALTIIVLALLARAGFAGPKAAAHKTAARPAETGATPLIPLTGSARPE